MKPKLNSTVSVVKISDTILEFFKSNTRDQVRIKVEDDSILEIACSLDGSRDIEEIALTYNVDVDSLTRLIKFMEENGLLDVSNPKEDLKQYNRFRRSIHFIEEYAHSHEDLVQMWRSIKNSSVLVVGLGAVGTWVACNLAQSGVGTIVLLDGDVVDVSNLHRQFGFMETDVGKRKVDVLSQRLIEYNPDIKVVKICEYLSASNLEKLSIPPVDLIINCADKPNVDTTSLWVGEYSMRHGVPHIIGGGYNLHLSLIGQTVIPGKTACVKCFEKSLEEENQIDPSKVKKLLIKNRKVGSFAPMCSLIASMIGMEAIKILSKRIPPNNVNRRGEFNIYNMDIIYKKYERRDDCEWCGKEGEYYST